MDSAYGQIFGRGSRSVITTLKGLPACNFISWQNIIRLRVRVPISRFYLESFMSRLKQLKEAQTKPQLADVLGIKASQLTHTLYCRALSDQYSCFAIPKKSGGEREIKAPTGSLKRIQSALSSLLLDCLDEINQGYFPKSEMFRPRAKNSDVLKVKCNSAVIKQPSLSHGFERKRSIITNAMMHIGKRHVLNIDLKDFFESFNFGRVRGFFIKNKNFQLAPNVATTIAQIACFENALPQGSPSSPVITNLITHSLDIRLARLANNHSCIYSRYADDITFSTNKMNFPKALLIQEHEGVSVGKKLKNEIIRAGFSINNRKTRLLFRESRQDVTGLVVNKKPNVKKEYWRTVRAQCNRLFKTGEFTKICDGEVVEGNIQELEGQLNFIDQIDHYNRLRQKPALNPHYFLKREQLSKDKGSAKKRRYLFNGRERTFSNFLFYKYFYANTKPLILTEGKTDNLYLSSAIKNLSESYPTLIDKENLDLKCSFLKYSERTRFLLELHGGGDYFKGFVENYSSQFKKYSSNKTEHPVIILVDNDSGPRELISRVKGLKGVELFPSIYNKDKDIRNAEFIHISNNLYLVLTPLTEKGLDTDIETFFTDKDRLRKYNGKYFNTAKDRDEKKDLSKESFARYVVQSNWEKIQFDNFKILLQRIVDVQSHYDRIK